MYLSLLHINPKIGKTVAVVGTGASAITMINSLKEVT